MDAATLTEAFVKKLPRENSGSNTSNAYDFQKDWSLCLLLELHSTADDYLIILDYHDDICVFDSEQDATSVQFFQVKTSSKQYWTLTSFTSKAQGIGKLSTIGKIYDNLHKFGCQTESLNFVSNAPYKFAFHDTSQGTERRDIICVEELSQDLKTALLEAIEKEHGLPDERFGQIMFFRVTDLSFRGHSEQTIGKLAKFLDERFPDKKCKPVPLYQALFSEISRKTDYGKDLSKYLDSLKRKSIGKAYFDGILRSIAIRRDFVELWRTIENTLMQEGFDALEIRLVRKEWDRLEIDMLDGTNFQLGRAFSIAKKEIAVLCGHGDVKTLKDLLHRMQPLMRERLVNLPCPYDDRYVTAIVLAAFYED